MSKPTLKPYLVNAFYTWAIDTNNIPIIEVNKHQNNSIPNELFNKNIIILNIHPNATRNMIFSKDFIKFEAILLGEAQQIIVDYESISKIFTKIDGYGLEFDLQDPKSKNPIDSNFNSGKIKSLKQKKHLTLIKNDN